MLSCSKRHLRPRSMRLSRARQKKKRYLDVVVDPIRRDDDPQMIIYFGNVSKKSPSGKTAMGLIVNGVTFQTPDQVAYDITTQMWANGAPVPSLNGQNLDYIANEIFQENERTVGYIAQVHQMYARLK